MTLIPHINTPKNKPAKRGFALVLAIMLMSFMVLLIISLASLVQLQLRMSRQAINENKAKQAAKFAAYQAMSEIQRAMGPDTRVTANAKMFDDTVVNEITSLDTKSDYDWWTSPMNITRDDANEIADQGISQNRYWVGVWDARNGFTPEKQLKGESRSEYTKNTIEKALTWLVSGNKIRDIYDEKASSIKYFPSQKLQSGNFVRAVSSGSASDESGTAIPDYDVMVPLVTLDKDANVLTGEVNSDGKQTRIAWWVSDESQKASLNAVASRDEIRHAERIKFRLQSLPFYSGIHGLTVPKLGGMAGTNAFDFTFEDSDENSDLEKIRNLEDVKVLDVFKSSQIPESIQIGKVFFHDVTFNTKGVLVNTREGGLKKDLSLGLTRKDFNNEDDDLSKNIVTDNMPEYFEQPFGVAGFKFKSSAYPLVDIDTNNSFQRFIPDRMNSSNAKNRNLNQKGHMFGPQMYGREKNTNNFDNMSVPQSTVSAIRDIYSDNLIFKDPGGPLWDQLRSYYNFRAEDNISSNKLSSRVQTDDRWGFKPIVKRFQVYYVPSFVEYSDKRYGLRLHIIPLLVLWNPYDVKIDGETYYAIRLYGSEYTGPGKFRFAIGYQSGNYFQCARDLRTEFMPSVHKDIVTVIGRGPTNNFEYKNGPTGGYDIRGFYMTQNNEFSSWTTGRDGAYNKFVTRYAPFSNETPGYSTNIDGINEIYKQAILPLGYGTLPDLSVMTSRGQWRSLVHNNNIYPSFSDAKEAAEANAALPLRVAKIPLYLNNLLVDLNHGTWKTMDRNRVSQNTYFAFRGQRNITAYNPKNADPLDGGASNLKKYEDISLSSDIHFLAYDKNGIEPGEGKIFAMERIVNYFGDLSTSSGTNGTIGPNGDIEGDGNTSEYERKKALMKPLDEGGVLGGCFYVDIPHPEAVHAYKYNTDRTSATPYEMGVSNLLNSAGNFNTYTKNDADVILDLNLVQQFRNNLQDVNNQLPPTDIGEYMIDMQDVCMTASHEGTWDVMSTGDSKPINTARPSYTPMGYYFYAFTPEGEYTTSSWRKFQHRHSRYYSVMNATVWIWKREGFSFSKYSNKNSFGILPGPYDKYEDRYKWDPRVDLSPVLAQLEGYRIFTGDAEPSFPDPTLQFERHKNSGFNEDMEVYSKQYQYRLNYYQPGRSPRQSRLYFMTISTRSGNQGQQNTSYREDIDGVLASVYPSGSGNIKDYLKKEGELKEDDYTSNDHMRAKFYINWLGVSSKRHSANYWRMYLNSDFSPASDFFDINNMVDMNPQSIGGNNSNQVLVVDYNVNPSYQDDLNKIAENQKGAPYGFIFMQPYANNGDGLNPFYNRRLYVNGSLQATYYGMDYNTINMTSDSQSKVSTKFGSLPKYMLGASQAYGNYNAYGTLGYKIERKSNKPYVGLDYKSGATTSPIHHVLRKTEVVHNPANLAGVTLTFGAGKASFDRTDGNDRHFYKSWGLNIPETLMQGSNAIGNSLAPSRMSPNRSYHITWLDGKENSIPYDLRNYDDYGMEEGQYDGKRDPSWVEDRGVIYDMSWHLNNVLWDEYFFSTLPYRNDEYRDKIDSEFVMPQNPRLRYYVSENSTDQYMRRLSDTDLHSSDNEDQFSRNAALLWINGPFNVNSTSVDAWKVVLSTYYGQSIEGYKSGTENIAKETPMHRWAAPLEGKAVKTGESIREDNAMTGYRSLNNDEIEELAAAIVEHIKDRGPFYSMSHFVNRVVTNYSAEERFTDQLSDDKLLPVPVQYDDRKNLENEYMGNGTDAPRMGHMQKGVLQAAIDSTSINSEWHKDHDFIITKTERNKSDEFSDPSFENTSDASKTWENWRAAIGPQGTGAPTYLMQQDILSRIGSFLTVRSDTFKIRAYGEIRNPISGAVEGKAWCEMTVQRTPEYFDTDTADQEPWKIHNREPEMGAQPSVSYKGVVYDEYIKDELSTINQELGRRFKVVGFRWLNEKEI